MLKDLYLKRQSCRNFDKEKIVDKQLLTKVLEDAILAPSACNAQPYSYYTVIEPQMREKIAKTTQGLGMNKFTENAGAFIVVVEEKGNLLSRTAGRVKDQQFAQIDIGLSVAHLILSAEESGLATCILGWLDEKKIKELLQIDGDKRVRLVIAVGYKKEEDKIRPKKRKDLQEIVHFF